LSAEAFFATYIVRIYRFSKNSPGRLVGVVEDAGSKLKKAFINYDELWNILNSTKSVARHKTETVKKGGEGKSLEQGKREFQNLEFWQRKEKKA